MKVELFEQSHDNICRLHCTRIYIEIPSTPIVLIVFVWSIIAHNPLLICLAALLHLRVLL